MINYKDIERLIRYEERDNNKTKFSDYDIKLAVGKVLRYMSSAQALQNTDFLEAYVDYDENTVNADRVLEGKPLTSFAEDGIDLPEDFVTLISVANNDPTSNKGVMLRNVLVEATPRHWEYKVTQNKIFTGCKSIRVHYKRTLKISTTNNSAGEIDLPETYLDSVVNLVRMSLNGDVQGFDGAISTLVDKMVPRRRYRNMMINLPWKV